MKPFLCLLLAVAVVGCENPNYSDDVRVAIKGCEDHYNGLKRLSHGVFYTVVECQTGMKFLVDTVEGDQ